MNPFTRFLMGGGNQEDESLRSFVAHWDDLEALIIRVFRSKGAEASDEAEYRQLRQWLLKNYRAWQEKWRPYWQESLVGGLPPTEDPFLFLLKAEKAADFVNNWAAMQNLPAARETINRYIQAE